MKKRRGIPQKKAKDGVVEVHSVDGTILKRFTYKLKNQLSRDAANKAAADWIKKNSKR